MTNHPYKRPHYYLVLLIIVVILTAIYVIGITSIYGSRNNYTAQPTSVTPTDGSTSTTQVVTNIFGTPVYGDIGAGTGTAVIFITQDTGGSGTFFYAVAFMTNAGKYTNTNAVFLGDRIAPQNVSISNGVASFNYCDRRPEDPFTAPPSVCVSKNFSIVNGTLTEIIN